MATSSIPPVSGIYKITCTANGKIYIGSSANIKRRWSQHQRLLRRDNHDNLYLQRAWHKYGEATFLFQIIEQCERTSLIEREQYYLDTLQPFLKNGFNIGRKASSTRQGRRHSLETRAKISASLLGKSKSPESRAKMSIAQMGKSKKSPTPAHREKLSAAQIQFRYLLTSPEGIQMETQSLRRFCHEYDLCDSAMCKVANGKLKSHKGWKCRKQDQCE